MSHTENKPTVAADPAKFDRHYFERYDTRNFLGRPIGERSYFYGFWSRYLATLIAPGGLLIEVGCGRGYLARRMSSRCQVVATDVSRDAVDLAKQVAADASFVVSDAQALPFASGSADGLVAFDVIEHLTSPEQFVSECKRVLKPGGVAVISTPNPQSLGARVKKPRPEGPASEWHEMFDVWHGWRDDTHINLRRINQWQALLDATGFTRVRDGTDFCSDTPYFKLVPTVVEKLLFNGSHRILTRCFGFFSWRLGENYFAVVRSPS